MTVGTDLPKPETLFDLDVWLHRWPASVYATELHYGVLVFTGRDQFDDRDVAIAERTYPGRRILLNDTGKLEVHPAGNTPPLSIFNPTHPLRPH
ncbi:hypothetical protein ACIP5Y_00370 [Nocardia sp. NPDC088792]|uniref:hypothetical protein n=1 Tax=Nocardia sp. NPDC088792 TaxID=3364332 RepID=UPI0038221BB5